MKQVNNQIYNELNQRWLSAHDDPVALLRAENRFRSPWLLETLRQNQILPGARLLDLGCGAGFLCRDLAQAGFQVTGVDAAPQALSVARSASLTNNVDFREGDLLHLDPELRNFDACFLMDVLEHVDQPGKALQQAALALRPGGLCFFYTFNRNLISHFLVIKGVEWFVKNTPPHLHVLSLFIKPKEMDQHCLAAGLKPFLWRGMGPVLWQMPMWRLLTTGIVSEDFRFEWKKSLTVAYVGVARKC